MVRTLQFLPESDAHRNEYIQILQEMAAVLKDCQREDGFWNMNLADETHFPGPETSGTVLFTYGMAWGINNGLLDKETYFPIVAKAWNGLCKVAVEKSGKLTRIQNVGESPINPSGLNSDVDFGIGAFLLAASEVVHLAEGEIPTAPEAPGLNMKSINILNNKRLRVYFDADLESESGSNINNYKINNGVTISKLTIMSKNSVIIDLAEPLDYGRYTLTMTDILNYLGGSIGNNAIHNFVYTVPLDASQPEIVITAIGNQGGNPPSNVMDNNLDTRWAQYGETGQWIKFDMGKDVNVSAVDISFYLGTQRSAYFDIEVSSDNVSFAPILPKQESSGLTTEMERYSFNPSQQARYVRIVCNSNSEAVNGSAEPWNSVTEVRIRYSPLTGIDRIGQDKQISIYPNPVTDGCFTVNLGSNDTKEVNVNIYDIKGTKLTERKVISMEGKVEIKDIELSAGTYLLNIENTSKVLSKIFFVK